MIIITFPDNSTRKYEDNVTPMDVAKDISEGLARNCVGAQVNDKLVDMDRPITENATIKLLTPKEHAGLEILRHSCAHILAQAVKRLYPQALQTIGPVIEHGFMFDFDNLEIGDEDLPKIEEEMRKIVKEKHPTRRVDYTSVDEAKAAYADNHYKIQLIEKFQEQGLSTYIQGEYKDLCRGPHTPNTGFCEIFKLTRTAKAYWLGDAKNKQLTRIYGLCFAKKSELDAHLKMLEEAEKRDHRKLGRELELFMFHEFSPGAPFFLPKGATMFMELQRLIREEYTKRGFVEVITPLLYDKALWETSGHWEHYKEDMFITMVEGREFSMKPMNCPSHVLIYKNQTRSYRDLPLRIADFAPLHRNELSGTLSGLTRVRKFSQDDAHIFCTAEQLEEELRQALDFVDHIYKKIFKMEYDVGLSTRPESFMGEPSLWNKAEGTLSAVLDELKIPYTINAGDGAFYGPKIDIRVRDALGRQFQCATIQLDFQMPLRFGATYEGADGSKHSPIMIHRAVLGSLERFFGIVVEHFAGRFPLWLSPEQVRILPIADRHNEYCCSVMKEMQQAGLRVTVDERPLTTNKKIREAELAKVNYILVVGDREVESQTVNVRTRDSEATHERKVTELRKDILEEIALRT